MDAYKFKAIKKFHDFEVMYTFTENELKTWLNGLSIMDRFSTCVKILSALQALKAVDMGVKARFEHVTLITAYIKELFKAMETVYIDCSFPLNNKEKTNAELLAWVNAEIAAAYQQIGIDHDADKWANEKQAYALNEGLKHYGKCLLHIAQVYQAPFDEIWRNCYRIYRFAEQRQLLDIQVQKTTTEPKTIETTFKQIVLFSLSDSNQYRPREMLKIYDIMGYFCQLLDITPGAPEIDKNHCIFSLELDQEPRRRGELKNSQKLPSCYQIDTTQVALHLYNKYIKDNPAAQGQMNIINSVLMIRVVRSLNLNQSRKFTRMQQSKTCKGIVGFKNLLTYVRGEKTLDVETGKNYDPRIAGQWSTPDFPLVKEGEEWMQQKAYLFEKELKHKHDEQSIKVKKIINTAQKFNDDIWNKSNVVYEEDENLENCVGDFEILDGSIRGYGLLWRERSLKVKIGETFGLLDEIENRVEIGLIRSIRVSNKDEIRLGVELIGLQANYVDMLMPGVGQSASGAILITTELGDRRSQSLVYSDSNFQIGEFVEVKNGKSMMTCRLSRLLHSTPAINHAEIFSP